MTLRIGVVGLGMMGQTHLDVYAQRDDAEVVAVGDRSPHRLAGSSKAGGNIEGQAEGGFDLARVEKFTDAADMLALVDIVDVCVPTPFHLEVARLALDADKHVLIEKPVCRTSEQAASLAAIADAASGKSMVAMCMRFWPGWTDLKAAVEDGRYGALKSASFTRIAAHPGGAFYEDAKASGAAILDLHLHDTDFVRHLLGDPAAVRSVGTSLITDGIDHVVSHYDYPGMSVVAEGGWAMSAGFPFTMRFVANFERATLDFDLARETPLMRAMDGKYEPVELAEGMGYAHEIGHFLDCVREGRQPSVSIADAGRSVALVEAEEQSVRSGEAVTVC
ncbi:MAG: Gfo/Idh/MocA family oxidoreductase [Planctomycetota bacterium]